MGYAEQKKEIETMKERTVKIKLSDADCERISIQAEKVGLTVGALLENFIGDLVDGTYSNGSDERMYAEQWFERCGFTDAQETFLSYLLDYDSSRLNDFIDRLDIVQECEEALKEEKDSIQAAGIREEIDFQNVRIMDAYQSYLSCLSDPEKAQPYDEAIRQIRAYQERKANLMEHGQEPVSTAFTRGKLNEIRDAIDNREKTDSGIFHDIDTALDRFSDMEIVNFYRFTCGSDKMLRKYCIDRIIGSEVAKERQAPKKMKTRKR